MQQWNARGDSHGTAVQCRLCMALGAWETAQHNLGQRLTQGCTSQAVRGPGAAFQCRGMAPATVLMAHPARHPDPPSPVCPPFSPRLSTPPPPFSVVGPPFSLASFWFLPIPPRFPCCPPFPIAPPPVFPRFPSFPCFTPFPPVPPRFSCGLWGNPCTARALRATFRLCSPRRAPRQTPWKRP